MAYGLHKIAHKNYVPDGTGRDWFFLGDSEFRRGRRTPMPGEGERPEQPKHRPRELPVEARLQRAFGSRDKATIAKKWKEQADQQPTINGPKAAAAAAKLRAADSTEKKTRGFRPQKLAGYYETTYGQHGRIQGFEQATDGAPRKYQHMSLPIFGAKDDAHMLVPDDESSVGETAGASASTAPKRERVLPGGPGAAERQAKGYKKLVSTYSGQLGQIPGFEKPEWGAPMKHKYHSSPLFPGVDVDAESKSDVLRMGTTYQELGKDPRYKPEDWGVPRKHRHMSLPVYPHVNAGPREASDESAFETTYGNLCRIGSGWDPSNSIGKHYDVGPVAYREFRFTIPPRTKHNL